MKPASALRKPTTIATNSRLTESTINQQAREPSGRPKSSNPMEVARPTHRLPARKKESDPLKQRSGSSNYTAEQGKLFLGAASVRPSQRKKPEGPTTLRKSPDS